MLGLARVQDNLLVAPVRSEQHFPAPTQSDSCQMMKELVRGPDRESVCAFLRRFLRHCMKHMPFLVQVDFKSFFKYFFKSFITVINGIVPSQVGV